MATVPASSEKHSHAQDVPVGALIGAASLIAFVLILLVMNGPPHRHSASASTPIKSLHLLFLDRGDGSVEVKYLDFPTPNIRIVPAGTNGFLRGVLRGLARARRNEGIGSDPPFVLTRWADGTLTLNDPQTGQRVALEVFGPDNSSTFARLLNEAPGA